MPDKPPTFMGPGQLLFLASHRTLGTGSEPGLWVLGVLGTGYIGVPCGQQVSHSHQYLRGIRQCCPPAVRTLVTRKPSCQLGKALVPGSTSTLKDVTCQLLEDNCSLQSQSPPRRCRLLRLLSWWLLRQARGTPGGQQSPLPGSDPVNPSPFNCCCHSDPSA